MNTYKLVNMKKNKLWVSALAMVLLVVSCSKEDLNLKPLDAISEIDVYNDIALLDAFVSGLHSGLHSVHFGDRMGSEGMADLGFAFRGSNGAGTYNQAQMDATNGEGVTFGLWGRAYGRIRSFNTFLNSVESTSLSSEEVNPLIAQVHFLRAYWYFELFRNYGDVPLITTRFEVGDDFAVSRNSVADIVDFIIQELDTAIPNLTTDGVRARATKQAALALKSRALLYAASELFSAATWEEASTAAKQAIDMVVPTNPLTDNYASIFLEGDLKSEVLFVKEYNEDNNQGGWSGANTLLWPNGYGGWGNVLPTNKFVDMFEMINGELPYLADGVTVNPASGFDPQNPYVNRDPRFYDILLPNDTDFKERKVEYWIEYADDGDGRPIVGGTARVITGGGLDSNQSPSSPWDAPKTAITIRKLSDESTVVYNGGTPGANTPEILMRTTELYLNYAEAELMLGNDDNARNALNTVRTRASVNMPAIPDTVTGNNLVEAYRKERAIELYMEEHRFHDIRRWKIAADVLGASNIPKGLNIEKRSDGTFTYDYTRIIENSLLNVWDDKQYLFPIPFSEIEGSGGSLEPNNPGY